MKRANRFGLMQIVILLTANLSLAAQVPPSKATSSAAIITELSGRAWYDLAGKSSTSKKVRVHNVELYDWLPAHATLHVPASSSVEVTFISGKRYKLTGKTKATLTVSGVVALSAGVQ